MISVAVLPSQPTMTAFLRTTLAQLFFHLFFAVLCPLVYRLSGLFRFNREDRWRAIAAHLFAALAVVFAASAFGGLMRVALSEQSVGIGDAIRGELALEGGRPFVVIFYFIIAFATMRIVRLGRERELERARTESFRRHAAELEAQLAQARLRALEMQLNPHFLFNALNSIASLVEHQRQEEAYEAIARLGNLLRRTLDQQRPMVELEREIAWVEEYLELERLRFSDCLRVTFDIDTGCRHAQVPAMLIQPLVENAVGHALGADAAATTVWISARRREDLLVLEVTDDGPGLPPGWTLEKNAGVGLANVQGRLQALFDGASSLELGEPRAVMGAEPRGVTARVELPWSTEEPAAS